MFVVAVPPNGLGHAAGVVRVPVRAGGDARSPHGAQVVQGQGQGWLGQRKDRRR